MSERTPEETPSITCPVCGMTSYHPGDIKYGYCANCHDFTTITEPTPIEYEE